MTIKRRFSSLPDLCAYPGIPIGFVALLAVVIGSGAWVFGAEPREMSSHEAVVGEMASHGTISYRVGASTWLTQGRGTFPVLTPLQVRSHESNCRIVLDCDSLFEGAPASEFGLSRSDSGLLLTVRSGSVLYALGEGARLDIVVPSANLKAQAGEEKPTKDNARRSVFTRAAHMGIVSVSKDAPAEIYNLKGRLVIAGDDQRVTEVTAGKRARIGNQPSRGGMVVVPTVESAMEPPASAAPRTRGTETGNVNSSSESPGGAGASTVGSWWIFAPVGPGRAGLDTVLITKDWPPPTWPPPAPRFRMSAWKPPTRPRTIGGEPPPLPVRQR